MTVNFGYDGAPDKTVWPGRAMYMCAGSVHSTVGNTVLNIMDGFTSENDGGDRNVFGCGYNDTVLGTVQINISGSPDIGNSFIYGGGNSIRHPEEWPVRILNQRQEEYLLQEILNKESAEGPPSALFFCPLRAGRPLRRGAGEGGRSNGRLMKALTI